MLDCFAQITPTWLNRAYLYNGSYGPLFHDFRYRLEMNAKEKKVTATTYSKVCYEAADDRETETFDWTEEGVEAMKIWLQAQYEAFAALETA
ncbi:MAG: hypothetical protein IKN81_05945 [Oscillospiraceae bacterium]|nr:hypothetical protein [Oscillospiraceae bacterium]